VPSVLCGEALSKHTTFNIGGPADLFLRPSAEHFPDEAATILKQARGDGTRVFILGAGSNIVAADEGFRGIVLNTGGWTGCFPGDGGPAAGSTLLVRSGTSCDEAANFAAGHSFSGLEFLAGLPGSIGGAVWMNARCYGKSIADILVEVEILDETFSRVTVPYKASDYDYKKSPFQNRAVLILSACLRVEKGGKDAILAEMDAHRKDRASKGHFSYPSAGSVFKNNPAFGKPSGKIIEELGLRGLQIGGARIADWHGNFIINTGGASSADVAALVTLARKKAQETLGIDLEPEIIFVAPQ
jgi:UDP-N-acetylmuramate dehydrogenase